MKFVKDLGKLATPYGIKSCSLWRCECGKDFKRVTADMQRHKESSVCKDCYKNKRRLKALTADKACVKCGETKSNVDFYFKNKEKTHRGNVCKACKIKDAYEYSSNLDPEVKYKYRRASHAKSYGLSLEEMDAYFVDASCGICNCSGDDDNRLVLDHCHSTGVIRGVLCDQCNLGLGSFKDNTENLNNAIKWLKQGRNLCLSSS